MILNSLKTPCHVINIDILRANLNKVAILRKDLPCKLLLAIKGFSSEKIFPYMLEYLDGIGASGLFEARLGYEAFGKEVHTFSTAYKMSDFPQIAKYSDYLIFNSICQFGDYYPAARQYQRSCGLRINPEYSEVKNVSTDPCHAFSRLGVRSSDLKACPGDFLEKIDGLHFHTMRGNHPETLKRTLKIIEADFGFLLNQIKWLNIGGGQLFAAEEYDIDEAKEDLAHIKQKYNFEIILEPCEGLMIDAGFLVAQVVDLVENERSIAIIDASAICHMPLTLTVPYQCEIDGTDANNAYEYRIAGPTCYPGDIWGDYSFSRPLKIGDKIVFRDTAQYSMVRSCMFNGIPLPTLAIYSEKHGYKVVKEYKYGAFLSIT